MPWSKEWVSHMPRVKAGTNVPGYSGGFAAWMVVSDSVLL